MKARAAATPIVLLVLAAGSVAYAYLVERQTVSDDERAARRRDIFPTFRVDRVSRVEIEHGRGGFVIERDADAGPNAALPWVIASSHRQRADPVAVDTLLRELELATRLRDVTESAGLGFDAPRARGNVQVGPVEYRFAIGADAPRPEGAAYMRVDGEGAFVVGRSLKVQLLRGPDAYRDRTLVALGMGETERIDVRAARGAFALRREGASFRVVGTGLRASRSVVTRVFAALADARAESFLDYETAGPLTAAGITVTLAPKDPGKPPVELRIGDPCPGQPDDVVVLRMPEGSRAGDALTPDAAPLPMSACTAKTLVDALRATTESLVDSSPLYAHADEIEQIRLEALGNEGARVELARKASGWHERAPAERDLDQDESDSANNLALSLASARSLAVRRAASDERFSARTRVTVVRGGDGATEIVELAAPDADGSTLARRIDDGAVLRLSRATARRFEPHAVALRSRTVWSPAFDPGAVVAIDDDCVHAPERLELRGPAWSMRTPVGFSVDTASVSELAGVIAHAKAEAWIAETNDGGFGFEGPTSCTVTFTLGGDAGHADARRVSLVFGGEGDGGVYAHTIGDPAVFVAPSVLRDLAARPAVDGSRLRIDPGAVTKLSLANGSARLVFERSGGRLRRVPLGQDAAGNDDKLETALADFYPLAALHTGRATHEEGMDHPTLQLAARVVDQDGSTREIRVSVGTETQLDAQDAYFARAAGVDATFAVPRGAVRAILDGW